MGGLGPSISSYLGRKPTANDIREVIRVIEGYPKATVLVDNSVAEGNQERSSQSRVQVDSTSSNQIDEQTNGIKSARHMPSETVSNPTDQELVAHETNLKNKRDTRLLPPRPPVIPKPKRHLRNYTRARTENEKEVGVADDFRKPTLGKNVVLHSQAQYLIPIAHPGPNLTVHPSQRVILDGRKSYDPNGDPLYFLWVQLTGGPSVSLLNSTTPMPSFVAPAINNTTTLTFELLVGDGQRSSMPTYSYVTIEPL